MIVALWRERSDGVAPMFPPGNGPYGPPLEMCRVHVDAAIDFESLTLARDASLSHSVAQLVEILGEWFTLPTIFAMRAAWAEWPGAMRELIVDPPQHVRAMRGMFGANVFKFVFHGL